MIWKTAVEKKLSEHFGDDIKILGHTFTAGGSINEAYVISTEKGNFFIKTNLASRYPQMFEKEAKGIEVLKQSGEIPVPEVVLSDETGDTAFLILNAIESGPQQSHFWEDFGRRLAAMHRHTNKEFGLNHNNYIGSLFQSNRFHTKWNDFYISERLEVQIKLARDNKRIDKNTVRTFERFFTKIDEVFPVEVPALLHGDLWSGNFMVNEKGYAVIIDPAVYYGHREMDLGMSQLFGRFSKRFYEAYNHAFALESGWQKRLDYYNLYPLMVHVNLFGGAYINSVKQILSKFVIDGN